METPPKVGWTGRHAVELYVRTYTTMLQSSGDIKIESLVQAHLGMGSVLHPLAGEPHRGMGRTIALLTVMFLVIGVPLAITSIGISARAIVEQGVHRVAETWAQSVGWEVDTVSTRDADVYIRLEGPLPVPDTAALKAQLDAAGVDTRKVTVNLVPIYSVKLAN